MRYGDGMIETSNKDDGDKMGDFDSQYLPGLWTNNEESMMLV